MGITGLLQQLRSITASVDVREYSSMTVGIDASAWLHRGVYGCATALALKQPTDGYLHFCESWLDMLLSHNVIPFFVFDGGYLPAKLGVEVDRRASRETAMAAGYAAHDAGDAATAHSHFSRAVDVTPAMALRFIRILQRRGVAYVVAPYEADAQLAYMSRAGIIQVCA